MRGVGTQQRFELQHEGTVEEKDATSPSEKVA